MEIGFRLAWLSSGRAIHKAFKQEGARALFLDYIDRIARFSPCRVSGFLNKNRTRESGTKIWVCDRAGGKLLSSEELAGILEKLLDSGNRRLEIFIGGADGFLKEELERLKPDFHWSFGPLTLAHELAAVVASEQIYRALTLINHLPYHSGH